MSERRQLIRLAVVALAFTACFAGLGFRLGQLHLGDNEELRRKATDKRTVAKPLLVGRGRILDRRGAILAMDLPVYHLNADPQMILKDGLVRAYSALLSRLLQLDEAEVAAKLSQPERRQVFLKHSMNEDERQRIAALKLKHLWTTPVSARYYPLNNQMGHVVGFSNADGEGSAGVERFFDSLLKGVPGVLVSQQDGRGFEMLDRRTLEIPPQAGADVFLTLDVNLQHMVEVALDDAMQKHRALGAWAVIENVRSGEILAMATRPDFNLNEYGRTPPDRLRNSVTGYVYEPGSTFKVAVIAAALNEGVVRPDTCFDCENGLWMYKGKPMRDFHGYGILSVADILKKSSNIGAAKIALLLGEARLEKYLRDFGIGRRSGIEIPGEEGGLFRPRSQWDTLTATRVAYGHSVGVTTLQMVNLVGAIGNRGFLMRPTVVRRVSDARGRRLREFEPAVAGRPIREETARLMCQLMTRVTEEGGTGRRAAIEGYAIAGKTGTAVKPVAGGYSSDRNIASFVGLAPAEDPAIAIMVVVDEPQPDHTGGVVAAPVFRQIAQEALRYLDIPPSGKIEAIDPSREEPPAIEEAPHVDWASV